MAKHGNGTEVFVSVHRITVNGQRYTYELEHREEGLTVVASGIVPFEASGESQARDILRTVYERWDEFVSRPGR